LKAQKLIKELKIISVIFIILQSLPFLLELLNKGTFNIQGFISITILGIFFVALRSEKKIGPIIGILLASSTLLLIIIGDIINYVKLNALVGPSILFSIIISSIFGIAFGIAILADSISLYKELKKEK